MLDQGITRAALGGMSIVALFLAGCATASPQGEALTTLGSAPVATAAQDQVVWQDELDRLADDLGLEDAYPVAVVREVTPTESQATLLACLAERGWVTDEGGGISVAPGQEDSYARATYECTAAYPVEVRYLQPLSSQAWALIYDHFTGVAAPCLEAEGLPAPELPTRDVFLADPENAWAQAAPQRADLSALVAAKGLDPDEFLTEVCPLTPPAESLYPEVSDAG